MFSQEKIQKILQWEENLANQTSFDFLEVARMYLGEIKTPYNKQKLVKQLAGFIQQNEFITAMKNSLSEDDVKILCAIKFIKNATMKKLADFFSDIKTEELYEKILNLEERLIIYSKKSNEFSLVYEYSINPFFEDVLEPYLSLEKIIAEKNIKPYENENNFLLSENFLFSFLVFINCNPQLLKASGEFKKNIAQEITEIFKLNSKQLPILLKLLIALKNLNIIFQEENDLKINWANLKKFGSLDEFSRLCFLCAASIFHFAPNTMQNVSKLLMDTLCSLKNKKYTLDQILKISFLIQQQNENSTFTSSRFASMIASQKKEAQEEFGDYNFKNILCSAADFSLLKIQGVDIENSETFVYSFYRMEKTIHKEKIFTLDSGNKITLLEPVDFSLHSNLIKFLSLQAYDVAPVFEITKNSAVAAFNLSCTEKSLLADLKRFSLYEIPKSLEVSISEWYESYDSANMFFGYVLKLNERNSILLKKDEKLKSHIYAELSDKFFLMDFKNELEAKKYLAGSFLSSISNVKSAESKTDFLSFKNLHSSACDLKIYSEGETQKIMPDETIQQNLIDAVNKMDATKNQKEVLISRIRKKIALCKSQLVPQTVRFELTEAGGMDFAGKIHVIENALEKNSTVQITVDGSKKIIGKIKEFEKKAAESKIKIFSDLENAEYFVSVASIQFIKILR